MGYAEKRGGYWRGRYKIKDGKYGTVADSAGVVVKFATKREAKQAADAEEVTVRRGQWRDPGLGQETFGEYASRWYAAQDLAASTMQNYKRHIEQHLLTDFEDKALTGILRTDVDAWEKKERAAYAASSVKTSTWLFTPAASGWYPKKAPQDARPVPVLGEPWPGIPARGRGAAARADACWLPIAKGLTPHGLRHTHRTMMEDLGTEKVLMDERMGHIDGSVSARYAHVTPGMRKRLMLGLTEQWEAALDARLAMCPTSPVHVLNDLLRAR